MRLDRWDAFLLGLATSAALYGRGTEATLYLACVALGVFTNWRDDRRARPHGGKDG